MAHHHRSKHNKGQPPQGKQPPVKSAENISVKANTETRKPGEIEDETKEKKDMTPKWWRKPEWCMIWLTALLAFFAGGSFWVFYLQLKETNRDAILDQRAWLEFSDLKPEISEGKPISTLFTIINLGKTAARQIKLDGFVEIVPSSQEPTLGVQLPSTTHITMGIMFPTDGKVVDVNTQDPNSMVQVLNGDHVISHDEFTSLVEARTYVAIHGQIKFLDIFHKPHWLHFCSWHSIAPPGHRFESKECVNYNNTDND